MTGSRVVVHNHPEGGFLRVPNDLIRDPDIEAGTLRVILWLASQSPARTIYKEKCADELGVTRTTLNKCLTAAQATPYLQIEPTGQRHLGNLEYVYHVDLAPVTPEVTPPVTRDTHGTVNGLSAEDDTDHPEPRPESGHDRVQNLDAKKTVLEDQPLSRSKSAIPTEIPEGWEPNHTHKIVAESNGWDLPFLVECFYATAAVHYEQRTDWDKTFSAFCRDEANGECYWRVA